MITDIAPLRRLPDVVAEYDEKVAAVPEAMRAFEAAGDSLKIAATVGGTWGRGQLDTGHAHESELLRSLRVSAWQHVYQGLNLDRIATANDKKKFDQTMADPPPFTLLNIRATFGDYVADPFGNILRGLAEVFCGLDPAYKSHDKVKIGVAGLPKRVILTGFDSFFTGRGKDQLRDILNALAAYQGKPLVTHRELNALEHDETVLLHDAELPGDKTWDEPVKIVGRGVRLRRFGNGNAHLFFEPATLRDINMALAKYYGEVLADCSEDDDKPVAKRASTAVSKDLQYYPTPSAVVTRVIDNLYRLDGQRVLEPSCGCGRFLDALRAKGAKVVGIEVDPSRAAQSKAKGHGVMVMNFLDTHPTADFDRVVMNPPFYGKHYAKHVRHAYAFLKPGGTLTAILPFTAREHGLLDDLIGQRASRWDSAWSDLPFGSFRDSGTNVNTTVLTLRKPEDA